MQNFKIKEHKTVAVVTCNLTADQWQLYAASMKCGTAARRLNAAVIRAAYKAGSRSEFINQMYKIQGELAEYGATDTEPNWVVTDIATKIYGEEYA